ncbi:MAG: hypothetical protein ACTSUV_00060 [Candidatus Ranarchaeia archaeon]
MENYGDWGNGVIYKIIGTTGFLATKPYGDILNNATHCHIMAYTYDNIVMDSEYIPRIVPIGFAEEDSIKFTGSIHPRHVEIIQIIGESAAAATNLNTLLFVLGVAGLVGGAGLGTVLLMA